MTDLGTLGGRHSGAYGINDSGQVVGDAQPSMSFNYYHAFLYTPAPINIADSGDFVRQHYLDFLSRAADNSGLAFWMNNIESCGGSAQCREVKRIDTSAAFFLSIEFQQTGYLVFRAYKAAYGNLSGKPVPVTLSEFLPATQTIGQGVVVGANGWEQQLENNKRTYFNQFVALARFTALYPSGLSAAQFVDNLNANSGAVLSIGERDSLINDLQGGVKTRAEVVRAVAEDAEMAQKEFNAAFVLMQYYGYLRRDPDSGPDSDFSGHHFWLGKLNTFNGDFRGAEMVKAFITSSEYRQRFGQ